MRPCVLRSVVRRSTPRRAGWTSVAPRALAGWMVAVAATAAVAGEVRVHPGVEHDGAPLRVRWTSPVDRPLVDLFLPPEALESDLRALASGGGDARDDTDVMARHGSFESADSQRRRTFTYLYLVGRDHGLGCMDRATGQLRWWMSLPGKIVGRPAFTPTGLYFIVGQDLFGLERHSGELLFRETLNFAPGGGLLAVEDGRRNTGDQYDLDGDGRTDDEDEGVKDAFIIPGLDGIIRQISVREVDAIAAAMAAMGTTSNARDLRMLEHRLVTQWALRMSRNGVPMGPPVLTSNRMLTLGVVESRRGGAAYVCAWDLLKRVAGAPVEATPFRTQRPPAQGVAPVVYGETVLMAANDGFLYGLFSGTNEERWKFGAGTDLRFAPQVTAPSSPTRITEIRPALVYTGGDDAVFEAAVKAGGPPPKDKSRDGDDDAEAGDDGEFVELGQRFTRGVFAGRTFRAVHDRVSLMIGDDQKFFGPTLRLVHAGRVTADGATAEVGGEFPSGVYRKRRLNAVLDRDRAYIGGVASRRDRVAPLAQWNEDGRFKDSLEDAFTGGLVAWRDRVPALTFQKVGASGVMVALRTDTGREVWRTPLARRVVARMEDMDLEPARRTYLVVVNDDGSLSGLTMATGTEKWRMRHGASAGYGENAREGMVFTLSGDGRTVQAWAHRR